MNGRCRGGFPAGGALTSLRPVPAYPRWQVALTERLFSKAVLGGMALDTSWRAQLIVCRALGQPLSAGAWDRMTFNDKVLHRKLVVRDPRYRTLCDKLATRAWVTARLGEDAVAPVLAVADRAAELAGLRGPFVLKGNHGSGMVVLVDADRALTPAEMSRADGWLGEDYARWSREWGYLGARRALIAEPLLANPPPTDYKFFVFDGRARAVHVDEDRFGRHRRSIMSIGWEFLGGCHVEMPDRPPARPAHLDEMVRVAERLGSGFDFIRVDLYDVGGRVVVGELTPYSMGGVGAFTPRSLDHDLGRFWTTLPTAG